MSDGHLVRRVQLDEVCPDKPLFLVKYDGHACVVNTVLLNEVRGKVQHLRGFHEDTGEMNQEAFSPSRIISQLRSLRCSWWRTCRRRWTIWLRAASA